MPSFPGVDFIEFDSLLSDGSGHVYMMQRPPATSSRGEKEVPAVAGSWCVPLPRLGSIRRIACCRREWENKRFLEGGFK